VLNRDLWERLGALVDARGRGGVEWHYVRGHRGIPGNERVDELADSLARGLPIELYRGTLIGYGRPILDVPDDTAVPKRTSTSANGKSTKAHSYLSVVNGQPMRHATWAECERRVKGQSGAKFKKAMSAADELAICREWKVDPAGL
jgi:ribonuclease HI